jgi:hypothetical protein
MRNARRWAIGLLVGLAGCGGTAATEPAVSATATLTPLPPTQTVTPLPALTPLPTGAPTATPTAGTGPNIGFLGVLRADNTVIEPAGIDPAGRPVFTRVSGSGFVLVIDAKPGTDRTRLGISTFNYDATDPTVRPDLQIEVNRNLGNGSAAVCDNSSGHFGGVPGIDPISFDLTQMISDAMNDLGCRFDDGAGTPQGRQPDSACVLFPDGEFRFVDSTATIEFCATVTAALAFPPGDTVVTARVRDQTGTIGPERQIVVRITGS